jgi:hypothetical protein
MGFGHENATFDPLGSSQERKAGKHESRRSMMATLARAWSGGSTFLWTQGYGALPRSRRMAETVRDVVFAGGLAILASGTFLFLFN